MGKVGRGRATHFMCYLWAFGYFDNRPWICHASHSLYRPWHRLLSSPPQVRESGRGALFSVATAVDLLSFLPGLVEGIAMLFPAAAAAVAALAAALVSAVASSSPGAFLPAAEGALPLGLASALSAAAAAAASAGSGGALFDLRWLRILRAMRLLRLLLLTGNLPTMTTSASSLLSGAVNVRLSQLVASMLALMFTRWVGVARWVLQGGRVLQDGLAVIPTMRPGAAAPVTGPCYASRYCNSKGNSLFLPILAIACSYPMHLPSFF